MEGVVDVEARIRALLGGCGAAYRVVDHAPIASAREAAAARGTALEIGGKAVVLKLDRVGFVVLAMRASDVLDGKLLRKAFSVQRYRFASAEELATLTGLTPGEVPPFGPPVLELPLFVDEALARGDEVAFTVGRRDRSFVLATRDWMDAAAPVSTRRFARLDDAT